MKIIILAGGGGTRLFPLSRSCYPKQFLSIAGQQSLLAQTISRFLDIVDDKDIVVVTNENYIFHVKEEVKKIHATGVNIITEPIGRNTAPAIAFAMAYCRDVLKCNDKEIMFVGPSDHLIKPVEKFRKLVADNVPVAEKGYIVTLGIVPNGPETGYGYIETTQTKIEQAFKVQRFKEKPDLITAKKYVAAGNYYWNGGMFMFSMGAMQKELAKYAPKITAVTSRGYENTLKEFASMPEISIDYAVAEKSKKIAVAPMGGIYWNDIGSFDAIADVLGDEDGNAFHGDIITDGCHNTMILGSKRLITGIDLKDIVIVDTPDALLVAKKGESQKVKEVVSRLKEANRKEPQENVTMYRPWGSYSILSEGKGYKVKKIIVNPGEKLSLQMHYHRSEHWTVISGTGKLTLDDKVIIFKKNESTYIPSGTRHRLENPGKLPLAIIEVQNGDYLGEDDIVRFDDVYGRTKE